MFDAIKKVAEHFDAALGDALEVVDPLQHRVVARQHRPRAVKSRQFFLNIIINDI